jgi:diguanylate cyclase (GGDEF)-like protein
MGDRLLQDIARMLKKTFRASDVVFRYGGDEFIVMMVDTGEEQAKVALDRLHSNVEKWNQHAEISGWKLSLSCGYFSYKTGMGIEELLTSADRRMYEEKHHGQNKSSGLGVRALAAGTA